MIVLPELVAEDSIRWGRPLLSSVALHALFALLLVWLSKFHTPQMQTFTEVTLLTEEDLDLEGLGGMEGEMARGTEDIQPPSPPMAPPSPSQRVRIAPARASVARPPRGSGGRRGSEIALSRPIELKPRTPLFGSKVEGPGGNGKGERIYLASEKRIGNALSGNSLKGSGQGETVASSAPPGPLVNLGSRYQGIRGSGMGLAGSGLGAGGGAGILGNRGEGLGSVRFRHGSHKGDTLAAQSKHPHFLEPGNSAFWISGPLKNREILKMRLPRYPRWAEEKGLEAQVSIRLTVNVRGQVKTNLTVERTSGFTELDQLAVESLRMFVFRPLQEKETLREEWGVATFNFRLMDRSRAQEDL